MIIVKHIDENWQGYVSEESWNSNLEYLLVSGDFEIKGRKVDGRLVKKDKLTHVSDETIHFDKSFITELEVGVALPSVCVIHDNGSFGFVYAEDWNSDANLIFVRDSEPWITDDTMTPHELPIDDKNVITGFLIERTYLKERQ